MQLFDERLPIRFWDKVMPVPFSGCWFWLGAVNKGNGYGVFQRGRGPGVTTAHRHSYQNLVGAIPEGLELDHLCRVRCCCNPAHLEPVTHRENGLRGDARHNGNENRIKTHCPAGHPYAGNNLYLRNGKRHCRECGREKVRARRARQEK